MIIRPLTVLLGVSSGSFISSIYYSSWSHTFGHLPSDIDLSLVTHVNYAFFEIDIDTMNLTLSDTHMETEEIIPFHHMNQTPLKDTSVSWAASFNDTLVNINKMNITSAGLIGQLNQMKAINPSLSISMSIGGTDSADNFECVANNKRGVDFFVNNTISQMLYYGFDGIDIDWEFPDKVMFRPYLTYMMSSFRLALLDISPDCGSYSLSLALPMDIDTLQSYQLDSLARIVDYFHLMGYDASGPDSSKACYHSPLYQDPFSDNPDNINQTVHYLIENGILPNQIVLGVPLYGHSFPVNKMYDPLPTADGKDPSCADIKGVTQSTEDCVVEYHILPPTGFEEVYNSTIGSAYATRESPPALIVYDNVDSMAQKTQFIMDHKLGGAFWWDSKGDTWASDWDRSLVRTFYYVVDGDLRTDICRVNSHSFHGALEHTNPTKKNIANAMVMPSVFHLFFTLIFSLYI